MAAVYVSNRNCIGTFLPWDSSEVKRALAKRDAGPAVAKEEN